MTSAPLTDAINSSPHDLAAPVAHFWASAIRVAREIQSEDARRYHGLHLLACYADDRDGIVLNQQRALDWKAATARTAVVPLVLSKLVADLRQPVVVVKGPELASRYPLPAARAFTDIDVLVEDRDSAVSTLERAGWRKWPVATRTVDHHTTMGWPAIPIPVEIHDRLNWPRWATPPSTAELVRDAVPSSTGLPQVMTIPRQVHAIYIASHAWLHCPMGQASDLVDTAVIGVELSPGETDDLSRQYRLGRLWTWTTSAAAALLDPVEENRSSGARLFPVRTGKALSHRAYVTRQVFAGVAAPTAREAIATITLEAWAHVSPAEGETPLRRISQTFRGVLRGGHSERDQQARQAKSVIPGEGGQTADLPSAGRPSR